MTVCKHDWIEEPYGYVCALCGMLDPCFEDERGYEYDGANDDDEDEWLYRCGWVRGAGGTLAGTEECDFECPMRSNFEKGMALTQARLAKRKARGL
jgi:hypothetical protein